MTRLLNILKSIYYSFSIFRKERYEIFKSEIPEYLGYGFLGHEGVKKYHNNVFASYYQNDQLVHQLSWDGKRYSLRDFQNGKFTRISSGQSMADVLRYSFQNSDLGKDYRFQQIAERVSNHGNLLLEITNLREKTKMAYYFPAGILFEIKVIITKKNEHLLDQLGDEINLIKKPGSKLYEVHKSYLLILELDHQVLSEPIKIASITARLCDLTRYTEALQKSGILLEEKKYRADIKMITPDHNTQMSIYHGEPTAGYLAFAITPDTEIIDPKDALNIFEAGAKKIVK